MTRVTRTTWPKGAYLNDSRQLEGCSREFVSFPLTLLARIPGPTLERRGV
ncbi:hypothetical protein SRB17_85600 [Streptomyces sp. RB17]|nr:hypothetical protein [Streptomyces sp. RB17]